MSVDVLRSDGLQAGYVRDADQRPNDLAVRWWYIRELDEGGVFVRGGRVRKARHARKAIRDAQHEYARDAALAKAMRRTIHVLGKDGVTLVPIPR